MELMEVSLSDIVLADDAFHIRTGETVESEPGIIRWMGAVNPPLIAIRSDGGGYRVVSGFEKISALRAIGSETIVARVMGHDECRPVDLMEIAILESQAHGRLSPVEVSRALNRLKGMNVTDPELFDRFLPLMGLEGNRATLDRYLSLDRLPKEIASAISRGEIGLDTVERVKRRFHGEEARRVLLLIHNLRLGVNRQREAIALMVEIATRDHVTVAELLEREEFSSILEEEEPNLPQRAQRFISALRRIRAPETMALLDEMKKRVRDLGLDPAVTLEMSPYLEEKLMRVSFSFRTPGEFRKILENLGNLSDEGAVDRLVGDLFGRKDTGEVDETSG